MERFLAYYEKDKQTRSYNDSSHNVKNIFLILSKVIYYHKRIEIETCWRLTKMLVEVRSVLPLKIVEEYYNWHLLLGKLVETAAQT